MASGNGQPNQLRGILVVEDDPEINRLIGAYVEFAGFQYFSAINGSQAFSRVREHAPSAVVLDLMLPDISGWEICRRLKSDRHTNDIPIIILTALDNDESRQEGLRCGAVEYLTKPFSPDQLLAVLKKYAGNREAEAGKTES
jgi:DNA-binding response OmpR family regulator